MKQLIDHSNIIDSEHLFWGNLKLQEVLTENQRRDLCDFEFYDWVSCLYWGEGIAMNYALKMSEISSNSEKWLEVYRDEHRHQTILGNWFVERSLTPMPKNKLITHAFKQVERIDSKMSEAKIVESIYSTQVFFEELFHSLLRIRLKHVKDRDLKAIFYQIYTDEADHLGKARTEINELNHKPKKLYQVLEEHKAKLFPLDISKSYLDSEALLKVKELQEDIVAEMLTKARSIDSQYTPLDILNKFQKIPEYNCIACSPKRHDGLHLEPILNRKLNVVEDTYVFPKRCEGFNTVVHGGFVGMVLDEMMGYAPILGLHLLPLTKSMNVTFRLPVIVGKEYRLESHIIKEEGQLITCKAYIKDLDGRVHAESEGIMYVPTKIQAPKILGKLAHHEVVQGMFIQ